MIYNRHAVMKYAHLLVDMEGFDISRALKQTWRDARDIREWVTSGGEVKYVCSFELVVIPGVRWVTPNQDWNEYHGVDEY